MGPIGSRIFPNCPAILISSSRFTWLYTPSVISASLWPSLCCRNFSGTTSRSISVAFACRNACSPQRSMFSFLRSGCSFRFTSRFASQGVPVRLANSKRLGLERHPHLNARRFSANLTEMANVRAAFSFFGSWSFPRHAFCLTDTCGSSRVALHPLLGPLFWSIT